MLDGVNHIMQVDNFSMISFQIHLVTRGFLPIFMPFKLLHNGHEKESSLSINISPGLWLCYLYHAVLSSPHIYCNCVLCFFYFKLNIPSEGRTLQL